MQPDWTHTMSQWKVPSAAWELMADSPCMLGFVQDLPWEVDAVKDDVYRWEVRLTRFDESSPLAQVRQSFPLQCLLYPS